MRFRKLSNIIRQLQLALLTATRANMSVVGLDFGSHAASIALWYENTDKAEVIADDLGFRTIPCAVAFRTGKVTLYVLSVCHLPELAFHVCCIPFAFSTLFLRDFVYLTSPIF